MGYEELACLFQLYDLDKDGIINNSQTRKVLTCMGISLTEDQVRTMARRVSCDMQGHSLSFNEFLTMVSNIREVQPSTEDLAQAFRSIDPTNSGEISEAKFRTIMKNKEGMADEDVDEMIEEYKRTKIIDGKTMNCTTSTVIVYKDFIS